MVNPIFDFKYIQIKCGSEIFYILRSSIELYKDSFLNRLIESPASDYPIHDGRHVIQLDRDPNIFRLILEFYRKNRIYIPYNVPYSQVYDEFDFFCLPIETNIRPLNVNYVWKSVNNQIRMAEDIINMVIRSEWFCEKLENNIEFSWEIGHAYKSEKDYTLSYDIFNKERIRDFIIIFLKERFNLKSQWITRSIMKHSKKKFTYFFPESITELEEDIVVIKSPNDILKTTIDTNRDISDNYIAVHVIQFNLNVND